LGMHVGRRIEEEPAGSVGAHGGAGLGSPVRTRWLLPGDPAGGAPAVPLGKAAAGGGTEKDDLH
jgi:hypothetical protein